MRRIDGGEPRRIGYDEAALEKRRVGFDDDAHGSVVAAHGDEPVERVERNAFAAAVFVECGRFVPSSVFELGDRRGRRVDVGGK